MGIRKEKGGKGEIEVDIEIEIARDRVIEEKQRRERNNRTLV